MRILSAGSKLDNNVLVSIKAVESNPSLSGGLPLHLPLEHSVVGGPQLWVYPLCTGSPGSVDQPCLDLN